MDLLHGPSTKNLNLKSMVLIPKCSVLSYNKGFDLLDIVGAARTNLQVIQYSGSLITATLVREDLPEPPLINWSTTRDVLSGIFQLLCKTETGAVRESNA